MEHTHLVKGLDYALLEKVTAHIFQSIECARFHITLLSFISFDWTRGSVIFFRFLFIAGCTSL